MNLTSPTSGTSLCRALLIVASLIFFMPTLIAKEISATLRLDRKETYVGGHALLNLAIKGDKNASVNVPEVEGLLIQQQRRSTQMQIVDGNISSQVSLTFLITPNKEGEFIIPPFVIQSGGNKTNTKGNLSLKVTAEPPPGQANLNSLKKAGDIAFLEVLGLKDQAVVGELIPVEIRAYFKSGTQVSNYSLPKLDSNSFIMKPQDGKLRQGRITIKGIQYSAIVFNASISPVKAGKFDLSFNFQTTLHIEDKGAQAPKARTRRSAFGNSFFGSAFTQRIRKNVKLISEVKTIEVSPPPAGNKPDQFEGTIGTFSATASASATTVRSGDPITLQVIVSGQGDLDRVPMPHFSDPSGWKTYPEKHNIIKNNSSQLGGRKIFKQIIVPKNESITEIPPLELIYYDPTRQSYQTARTKAIPIKVAPGTHIEDDTPATSQERSGAENPPHPIHQVPNKRVGWLRNQRIDSSPWFLSSTIGLAAVMLVFLIMLGQRRHNNAERQIQAMIKKEIQSALNNMEHAIQDNHASRFFTAARQALQTEWGQQCQIAPEAVTGTDMPTAEAREIFDMADAIEFSGENPSPHDFNHWKQQTLEALESFKATPKQQS